MIHYGVLGVGHLGRFHAMQASQIESVKFVGVYDANYERTKQIAEEFKVTAFKTRNEFYEAVDAFSLVSITSTHFEIAKEALLKNKHILIEKPITTTIAEADELIAIAKKNNLKIQVGHIERFNSAFMGIKDLELAPLFIESHRMAPFNARGTDVAVILDLMIHDIDLILTLVKSPVKLIQASGIPIVSESEDIANCRIEFENGCITNITASRISANKMRKMRLFQHNAYISLDFNEGTADLYYIDSAQFNDLKGDFAMSLGQIETSKKPKEIKYSKFQKKEFNPLKEEIISFTNAIINNTIPIVSATDGRNALEVAAQIIVQMKTYQDKVGFKTHD